ncbi:hypothetical protein DFH06DRAFT_1389099 [Mycena polygramma]|nr:hypothetical protein DFH06DRAFT_1389099 [Mycena polygramma]
MDIHIILNPGAVGTPPKAQHSSKKKILASTPTSAQSSPGSAIRRRSSLRSSSVKKSYATPSSTPIGRRHPRTSPSPLVRQSRPKKRVEERTNARRGRSNSTSTHSSSRAGSLESAASGDTAASSSRARMLLSRAKQQVATASALGRTRSVMDVVMDLKVQGPAGESELEDAEVFMLIEDRSSTREDASLSYHRNNYYSDRNSNSNVYAHSKDNNNNYVLTDAEGLAAYWAEQAAIWMDRGVYGGFDLFDNDDDDASVPLTRFPVSMERSTATWEYP